MQTCCLHQIQTQWPAVLAAGYRIIMSPQQVVFYAGHVPLGLYILHWGTVEFVAPAPDCDCQREIACTAPRATLLCAHHVCAASPYCGTCVVVEPCVFTVVPRAVVQRMVGPTVCDAMATAKKPKEGGGR